MTGAAAAPWPARTGTDQILEIARGFAASGLLFSAMELGLFQYLADGPAQEAEILAATGLHQRAARDFLEALVALGLLAKEGNAYRNSDAAGQCLVPGGPSFIGGFLARASHMLYPIWQRMPDALRTGLPQVDGGQQQAFAEMTRDPVQLRSYLGMMDGASAHVGPSLAALVDWARYSSMLDLGGARGNLAADVVKRNPHLRGAVFDLPSMADPFREHMAELGTNRRVTFHGGDFYTDPLPSADVVVLGHVLHNWPEGRRRQLIARAFGAVCPGGLLLIYDPMLTDEAADLANLMISLDMLLLTDGGGEYTVTECEAWLRNAGFAAVTRHPLPRGETLLAAQKA